MADTKTSDSAGDRADPERARLRGDLEAELEAIRADIAALARTVSDYGRLRRNELGAEAQALSAEALAEVRELLDHALKRLGETEKDIERRVRGNPAPWIGGLLGLLGFGLLLGLILGNRR